MTTNGATTDGLEGVVVADTQLSDVDGERGRLVIRGHDVEALALARTTSRRCARCSGRGALPSAGRARRAARAPGPRARARVRAPAAARRRARERRRHGRAARRARAPARERHRARATCTGADGGGRGVRRRLGARAARRAGRSRPTRSSATPPTICAWRAPRAATRRAARALDAYLVTVADHGMNASTFTARVVASTGSDPVSAVVAALGALKGPLHGGAPGPVLDMLDAIGSPERAAAWLAAELAAGRRIMGMGHRVYRVRDPRAAVLERAVERLRATGLRSDRLDLARAVEAVAVASLGERQPERRLAANVEFYTAVLLDAVGLAAGAVLADVRRGARGRLARARRRAGARRPADPARRRATSARCRRLPSRRKSSESAAP